MILPLSDYTYDLPAHRIATHPLAQRDQSKLLVYRQGTISHQHFPSLVDHIPANALLVFNDTKVIPARLHFTKPTGATIEIFLLHPVAPSALVVQAMEAKGSCTWQCTIGNVKRWKDGDVLEKVMGAITLRATLHDRDRGLVTFSWNSTATFAEVVTNAGETPLPPYLKRAPETADRERYQTVYSHYEGAVAAPTAGLHFTPPILDALSTKGVTLDFVTLHVSAGTFQPVKVENAAQHTMHNEQVVISRANLVNLLNSTFTIAVGTTSMRTLESLYWFGVKLLDDNNATFNISQHDPYAERPSLPGTIASLSAVHAYMEARDLDTLTGETSIYIMPGYTFRVCRALVTNFHQPASTLILLVAAFVGSDWKRIYEQALASDYRFLSYGDSSLLMPFGG